MFKEDLCTVCGECLSWCRYIDIDKADAPGEFRKLLDGEPSRVISECVSCMGCDEICPEKANPYFLIMARQEEENELDRYPFAKGLLKQAVAQPTVMVVGDKDGPVIDLCRFGDAMPELFEGTLFEGATLLKGGDYYCRFGYYHFGAPSRVDDHITALVERIASSGADEVAFAHDDCYSLFSVIAAKKGMTIPFRPISWPEFLYTRMKAFRGSFQPLRKKVAYQRPCASHYTPEKDTYIDQLFDLIGVTKPERQYEKAESLCCGLPVLARDQNLGERFLRLNLEDAAAADAELLVTLCPMCLDHMRPRAPEFGLQAIHITDLCRSVLGEIEVPGS